MNRKKSNLYLAFVLSPPPANGLQATRSSRCCRGCSWWEAWFGVGGWNEGRHWGTWKSSALVRHLDSKAYDLRMIPGCFTTCAKAVGKFGIKGTNRFGMPMHASLVIHAPWCGENLLLVSKNRILNFLLPLFIDLKVDQFLRCLKVGSWSRSFTWFRWAECGNHLVFGHGWKAQMAAA